MHVTDTKQQESDEFLWMLTFSHCNSSETDRHSEVLTQLNKNFIRVMQCTVLRYILYNLSNVSGARSLLIFK